MSKLHERTKAHINWFAANGINRFDFGVLRPDGSFVQSGSQDVPLVEVDKHMRWLRAENAHDKSNVYVRPARGYDWPIVMLDDITDLMLVQRIGRKYDCLAVQTSAEGGCQLWLATTRNLSEAERYAAQSLLCGLVGSDRGSVSGEHYGRLVGFKNHKRNGQWVNLFAEYSPGKKWAPTISTPKREHTGGRVVSQSVTTAVSDSDDSESGREWGWAMGYLSGKGRKSEALTRLLARAVARGKRNPEEYAAYTIEKAANTLAARGISVRP